MGARGCLRGCRSPLLSDLRAGSRFGAPALLDERGEVWAACEQGRGRTDHGHCSSWLRLLTAVSTRPLRGS